MLRGVLVGAPRFTGTARAKYVGEYPQEIWFVHQQHDAHNKSIWDVHTAHDVIAVVWGWVAPEGDRYSDLNAPYWDRVVERKGFRTVDGSFTFDAESLKRLQVFLDAEMEAGH